MDRRVAIAYRLSNQLARVDTQGSGFLFIVLFIYWLIQRLCSSQQKMSIRSWIAKNIQALKNYLKFNEQL